MRKRTNEAKRYAQVQAAAVEREQMKEQAREAFNKVAAHHRANGNPDRAAEAEIAREYFLNPQFREWLKNHLWEQWSERNVGKFA